MFRRIFLIVAVSFGLLSTVQAADDYDELRAALKMIIPDTEPDAISESGLKGIYEVSFGAEVIYISGDARYLINGSLIDLKTGENLTEGKRAEGRLRLLESVDEKDMVIYAPENIKHTITVFTDIDCGYCRRMHSEMAELNNLGIAVRYLFFPRAGLNSKSYVKAVSVWCSDDPLQAMTDAKNGKAIPEKSCDNPVDEHMVLVRKFGITGTPTLVMEDGQVVPGYIPAQRLAATLEGGPGFR